MEIGTSDYLNYFFPIFILISQVICVHLDFGVLSYDPNSRYIKYRLAYKNSIVFQSAKLREMLGFDESYSDTTLSHDIENRKNRTLLFVPPYPCYFNTFLQQMYIYTSIIEYSYAGDRMSPLLKTVTLIPNKKNGDQDLIHLYYENPRYVKVKSNIIKEIDLHMADQLGHKIDLRAGKVIAILHFKKITTE